MPPKRKASIEPAGNTPVVAPSALNSELIDAALSRYDSHISQLGSKPDSKLRELDDWRLSVLSELVRARNPAYLDKPELQKLVEWKLSRGKFRPTLPGLVAQNTEQTVRSSTQAAFTALSQLELAPENLETRASFRTLLKSLCASLKGVGPATASLVLSVYHDRIPFMSDEAYTWAMYADDWASSKKREVKYTEKAYLDYAVRMWNIAASVDRTPFEVERIGWVLGRDWISAGNSGLKPKAGSADDAAAGKKAKRQK